MKETKQCLDRVFQIKANREMNQQLKRKNFFQRQEMEHFQTNGYMGLERKKSMMKERKKEIMGVKDTEGE